MSCASKFLLSHFRARRLLWLWSTFADLRNRAVSKLYFLVPTLELAERIVTDLQTIGIGEEDIGVVAQERHAVGDLPRASLSDASDIGKAGKQGAVVGGTAGFLVGLAAAGIPGGLVVGGLALLGGTIAGGAIGVSVASVLGMSSPNDEVAKFERAIRDGELLMIVHCDDDHRERVKRVVVDRHPKAAFGGENDAVPPVV